MLISNDVAELISGCQEPMFTPRVRLRVGKENERKSNCECLLGHEISATCIQAPTQFRHSSRPIRIAGGAVASRPAGGGRRDSLSASRREHLEAFVLLGGETPIDWARTPVIAAVKKRYEHLHGSS